MEKVSIVIPVYNSEKYLAYCLESALNQTYKEIEVIAVYDEGSTDNSLQILNKYANRIKILSKENDGLWAALNVGIKGSTGEWIKQLDSDDILYPDAVEVLLTETKKYPDKANTMFYANFDFIDSDGKILSRHLEPNYNNLTEFDYNVRLLDHYSGNPGTTLIHKSTFDKYGYYVETIFNEDYELRLKFCLLHHCRFRLVQKTVLKYRIHLNQLSFASIKDPASLEKMKNNILIQLDPFEREKYRIALNAYKKNRPFVQRLKHFLGRWLAVNLPTSISNKIRMFNFIFLESRKNDNNY